MIAIPGDRVEAVPISGGSSVLTDEPTETLGERVKALRLALGLDGYHLAVLADVSPAALSNIESGKTASPTADTVAKLARALGVSTDYLISGPDLASGVPVSPLDDVEWLKAAAGRIMAAPPDEAYRKMRRWGRLSARDRKILDDMLDALSRASGRMESKRTEGPGGEPSEDEDEPPDPDNLAGRPVAKDYDALPSKPRPRS